MTPVEALQAVLAWLGTAEQDSVQQLRHNAVMAREEAEKALRKVGTP